MGGFADVMAFQGAGMAGRPNTPIADDLVRDIRVKSIEYQMGEILRGGGFSVEQTRAIIDAVLPSVVAGRSLDAEALTARLTEIGFPRGTAEVISRNIAIGRKR